MEDQEDLHGQVVRIVFGPARAAPGVVTIQVTFDPRAGSGDRLCIAGGGEVTQAYEILTGAPAGALAGTQVLVDGAGWLRSVQAPGAAPGWDDPATLAAAVRDVETHPLAAAAVSHAGMQM